ncbi:galactose-specific lectin nattectin-like [Apostichopus japonicus]|uniref:galactose-specific lectin nattectin-like n=1 Tax=Stichopus japonicus TaxID=307972 RepID=UPI003AB32E86
MDTTAALLRTAVFLAGTCILVEGGGIGAQVICPAGYKYYQGSCYSFKTEVVNFETAREICQADGGDLTSIMTRSENIYVGNMADGQRSWIGGIRTKSDAVTTSFRWVSREPWGFTSWRKREPNNWGGREHCIETNFVRRAWWNDHFCTKEKPFVCEISIL